VPNSSTGTITSALSAPSPPNAWLASTPAISGDHAFARLFRAWSQNVTGAVFSLDFRVEAASASDVRMVQVVDLTFPFGPTGEEYYQTALYVDASGVSFREIYLGTDGGEIDLPPNVLSSSTSLHEWMHVVIDVTFGSQPSFTASYGPSGTVAPIVLDQRPLAIRSPTNNPIFTVGITWVAAPSAAQTVAIDNVVLDWR
jgi:hypothetical protein